MYWKNIAIGMGMTLGVQLVPGAWVKSGDVIIPNTHYVSKGGPGYTPGGSDYQSKTGSSSGKNGQSGNNDTTRTSGTSGGNGGSGGGSGFGSGGRESGGGSGGRSATGIGTACGGTPITDRQTINGILEETNLNDALPYAWAKNFWLCGCPLSLAGSGLYWENEPMVMCVF